MATAMSSHDTRHSTAERYATVYGWAVFPLSPRSKVPYAGTSGLLDATRDPERIREWRSLINGGGRPNLGIATGRISGIVVIDIDPDHGGDDTWHALIVQHGDYPETIESLTPRGGRHIYFLLPDGCVIRNSAGKLGPGVDVRGDGGYVVAPPSVGQNGRGYEWEISSNPDDGAVAAPLPGWLRELIEDKPGRPAAIVGAVSQGLPQGIPQGQRNSHMASLAGTMRRRGMSEAAILAALTAENERCEPPLPLDEVHAIARSVARYAPGAASNVVSIVNGVGREQGKPPHTTNATGVQAVIAELTDAGNADRFVARHGENVRYNEQFGWMVWTGTHWSRDSLAVSPLMVETAISIHAEAARCPDPDGQKHITKWAIRSQMAGSIQSALWLARSLVVASADLFDAQPLALTVANGTLDLRTGTLGPHRREDYATRCVAIEYDQDALCPTWDAFLARILPGQPEREFIQRAIGYSLTGSTTEQVLFFLYGHGANGKTVLVETLRSLLGAYQSALDAEAIMVNAQGRPAGSIATLVGARVAAVPETPEGGRLNEVRIKELTGGDTVGARFLYKEAFDFKPQFKLWIRGNHKPQIRGTDDGIWRRFALIHLGIQIPEAERDAGLQAKLLAELPGILAWAVRGAVEWYEGGLRMPDSVRGAVAEYRSEMDTLGDFLAEMCVIGPRYRCSNKAIYSAYEKWCEESGTRPMSKKALGSALGERGFKHDKSGSVRGWWGLGLEADGWAESHG